MEPRRMETPNRNSEDYSMKDACWKRLVLPVLLLTVPLVLFCPVHAQTIIWVGDGFDDDFDGVQDDSGWVDLLTNQGYTVDNRPTYWSYLTTGKIAELEAADLVIVSRNTDSGQYDDGAEVAQWNGIATPLILMSAHIARSSRWRFFNSTEVASTADPYLMALDTGHPAFAGVTLAGGNLVNVLDGTVGPSSFVCVTTAGNGTVVARQAGGGYVWIAEWQAGTEYYSGAGQMAGGPRVWLVGGTQEGGGVGRGEENYTPDGEAIFLNLVAEFTGGANQPPEVDAGPDRELTMPSNMLTLDATVSDDGLGLPNGHLALEWSLVSGPGTVRFDPNAYVEDPRVTFERHRHGEYVLRLDASDGELDAHDTVTVTIHEPICPVGDLNADCKVDALDLHLFSLQWLTASGGPADFSGDDLVNLDDYRWLADNWLENWQTGSLLVTLYPLEVNSDGARWRVDGGDWLDGGVPVTDLAVGPHPVDFSPVAGWDTPSSRQVQIVYEQTTTTSATYIRQTGSLQVYLYPPEAIGAQWRVGEFAWKDSGEIQTGLPTGDYTIEFQPVGGWISPAAQEVTVEPNQCTVASATYSAAGTIVINEFLAQNILGDLDPLDENDDWIELYNASAEAVDVGGMFLTDDLDDPNRWQFPLDRSAETTIPSGGYLVIWADEQPGQTPGLHANFALNVNGEEIGLFDIEGVLVDSIVFDDQVADVSFGREPDGSDTWVTLSPTLGASNNGAYLGLVADTKFSPDRGFYEAPFEVEITCATPEATIYYTTDGSEPIDADGTPSPAAQVYSESNKPTITTTTCLRAAAAKDGWKSTDIDTQTYLFLDDVVAFSQQQAFNAGYPTIWYNSYPADYEMDQTPADLAAIAGDPGYTLAEARQVVKQSLLAIPTLSIATDKGNLFNRDYDPVTGGIYIYTGHLSTGGIGWERPVSAELFDPAGRFEPFQINCGLRLQGGESRRADKDPKHSFSLRFRGLYGEGKLRYRLFEDSPVDEFDSLQLRAMFNNSWSHWDAVQRERTQMIRDQWMRDTLLAMGQIDAGRGIFVHLYLNGIYWGLYNVHERPLADHYAEYFGGVEEDYDAINGGAASDGDLTAWYEMKGVVAGQDWDQIQQVLDVDNYIDWTILNRYSHNLDLKSDGNWRAAGGGPGRAPWHLYSWDSEHVLEGPYNEGINPSPVADPPGLWSSLAGIDEFMVRVHDRVRRHFFHGGALYVDPDHPQWDPDHLERNRPLARWARLAEELDQAIIAESARWGDYRRDVHPYSIGPYELYTRNDHWIPERDRLMNDYFPYRSGSVLDQLRNIGLYPTTDAPEFAVNGAPRHGGYVALGDSLSVTNPDGAGTIYYTLNGNDPRLPGGAVNTAGGATAYGGAVTISRSLPVKARVISGSQWSALSEAVFAIPVVAQKLRITELMYHPLDGGGFNDEDYEFIELQHIGDPGDDPINLNLVRFTNGIDYAFDDSVVLSPGDYVVLVKNQAAFAARYNTTGMNIAPGHYDGSLDNGGEEIDLADALGAKIHNFDYDDGWYEITDGLGFSLTSRNPRSPDPNDWDRKEGWRASYASDGSPGEDDSGFVLEDGAVLIHELLAHADTEPSDWIELYNATAGPIDIGGWFLSDDDQDLKKYEIEENYILPAGGYAVFKADPNFGPGSTDPGAVTPFALSENGEKVYLTSGSVGKLTGLYSTERSFGPSAPDVAFGHYVKSTGGNDFVAMSSNTPGWANAYPKIGPLVITEIAYHPASNGDAEYVELVNVSGAALTLYDAVKGEPWRFVDDGNDDSPGLVYRFPTETPLTLAAGEYLLLVKDEAAFTSVFGSAPPGVTVLAWGLANGSLSNGGEKPEIQMPGDLDDTERQWIRVDRVSYDDESPWPTAPDGSDDYVLRRLIATHYGNDVANWVAATPTPGQ